MYSRKKGVKPIRTTAREKKRGIRPKRQTKTISGSARKMVYRSRRRAARQ